MNELANTAGVELIDAAGAVLCTTPIDPITSDRFSAGFAPAHIKAARYIRAVDARGIAIGQWPLERNV